MLGSRSDGPAFRLPFAAAGAAGLAAFSSWYTSVFGFFGGLPRRAPVPPSDITDSSGLPKDALAGRPLGLLGGAVAPVVTSGSGSRSSGSSSGTSA